MNNKGVEFSFGWIFALIAGAVILALAIYGVSNFIGTQRSIEDSSRGLELSALLKNLETGLEQQGTARIDAGTETRITNNCSITGFTASEKTFGVQFLRTATSSKIGSKFEDNGVPLASSSIYVFSDKIIEGDEFVTLSESFEYPFKIADIVSIWPADERYCFVGASQDIRKKTENLGIPGLNFTTTVNGCLKDSKKVCFTQKGCDIDVATQMHSVSKKGKTVYYDSESSALFYAAIFSDKDIYECQIQRLAHRGAVLARIYSDKATIGNNFGCPALNVASLMSSLSNQLNTTKSSLQLVELRQVTQEVENANDALACRQF